jgi:hypothetical protein
MVVGQLVGVRIRLLEFERTQREQEELEERLRRLEELAASRDVGRSRWAR